MAKVYVDDVDITSSNLGSSYEDQGACALVKGVCGKSDLELTITPASSVREISKRKILPLRASSRQHDSDILQERPRLYALIQGRRHIKFRFHCGRSGQQAYNFSLYCLPDGRGILLYNESSCVIMIGRPDEDPLNDKRLCAGGEFNLPDGVWSLRLPATTPAYIDVRILKPSFPYTSPGTASKAARTSVSDSPWSWSEDEENALCRTLKSSEDFVDVAIGHPIVVPGSCITTEYSLTKEACICARQRTYVAILAPNGDFGRVVIKVVRSHESGNIRRTLEGFMVECNIQHDLDHPNVIKAFDCDARHLFLYLQYGGVSLGEKCSEKQACSLTPKEAGLVGLQTTAALAYIHDQGIIHFDIKPGNILVDWKDRGGPNEKIHASICDFGTARWAKHRSLSDGAGGTPLYYPPEAKGLTNRDEHGDVWALGVTLLYAFRRIPLPERSVSIQRDETTWKKGIVKIVNYLATRNYISDPQQVQLWKILKAMLEPKPEQRATASLIHELMSLLFLTHADYATVEIALANLCVPIPETIGEAEASSSANEAPG